MTFGETLQQLREQAQLTQMELAQKSGVPLRTIQGWEQDSRCPVSPDFFKVVQALETSADAFAASALEQPPAPVPEPPRKGTGGTGTPDQDQPALPATPSTPPAADLEQQEKTIAASAGTDADVDKDKPTLEKTDKGGTSTKGKGREK